MNRKPYAVNKGFLRFAILVLWCLWGITHISVLNATQKQLQRGAKLYINYCSGCHSLHYLRYERLAQDLGLMTENKQVGADLVRKNLIFTQSTLSSPIDVAMAADDARQWFGVLPPDLSLIARQRGKRWLSSYLKGFYQDSKRPFHTNNIVFPDVAMPDILAPLSGVKRKTMFGDLVNQAPGKMTEQQFNATVSDLVSFLSYVSEPERQFRYHVGRFVLAYLLVLLIMVALLKKRYCNLK